MTKYYWYYLIFQINWTSQNKLTKLKSNVEEWCVFNTLFVWKYEGLKRTEEKLRWHSYSLTGTWTSCLWRILQFCSDCRSTSDYYPWVVSLRHFKNLKAVCWKCVTADYLQQECWHAVLFQKNTKNSGFAQKVYHLKSLFFTENLLNITRFPCLHYLVKTKASVWENSRADQWKPERQSKVSTCSRIITNFAEVVTRLWRYG